MIMEILHQTLEPWSHRSFMCLALSFPSGFVYLYVSTSIIYICYCFRRGVVAKSVSGSICYNIATLIPTDATVLLPCTRLGTIQRQSFGHARASSFVCMCAVSGSNVVT